MTTRDKIKAVTPLSITTMDNPIFRVTEDISYCGHKRTATGNLIQGKFDIKAGTLVRILACNLNDSGATPVRYQGYDLYVDNKYLSHHSGKLGDKIQFEKPR